MIVPPETSRVFDNIRKILARTSCSGEAEARELLECCGFVDALLHGLAQERRLRDKPHEPLAP